MVNHYYDATDGGTPRLNVRRVSWRDGWPMVGDPLNPSRQVGHGDAYVRLVERSTDLPVVDVGCGYEGADLALGQNDPSDRCQQWQFGYRGGVGLSLLNRFSNKVGEDHACENFDGGPVALWGWIAFLGNNDCQRWQAVSDAGGWVKIQSILTGSRVFDVSRCAGGGTDDVVVNTASAATCQDFRFEPVGAVLLIDQKNALSILDGPRCPAYGVVANSPVRPACRQWRFTSVAGAEYTIADVDTGRLLGTSSCPASGKGQLRILRQRTGCQESSDWTITPNGDGTWTLSLIATPITENVKLLNP
jgi:hypothetical protein